MRLRLLLVLVLLALVAPGCRSIKAKLGIGELVTNPDSGSPEKLVQDVLRAAKAPEEAGWESFAVLLHSEETTSPVALQTWREMKWPAIRKKVDLLLVDKAAVTFKVMDRREEGKSLVLLVANSGSDMPTPCRLQPDPAQGGAWRIFNSCF